MKKSFIVISLIFFPILSNAQFKYGILGSINLTSLHLDPNYFEDNRSISRFGFSFGLGGEFHLSKLYYLQSDINLISKNFALNVSDFYGEEVSGYDRYNVLYLDVPVKFGLTWKNYRIYGGAFFDYSLKSTNLHDITILDNQNNTSSDIASEKAFLAADPTHLVFPLKNLYSFDTGYIIGVGHQNENFCLNLSYSVGLINIFPKMDSPDLRKKHPMHTRVLKLELFFYL